MTELTPGARYAIAKLSGFMAMAGQPVPLLDGILIDSPVPLDRLTVAQLNDYGRTLCLAGDLLARTPCADIGIAQVDLDAAVLVVIDLIQSVVTMEKLHGVDRGSMQMQ